MVQRLSASPEQHLQRPACMFEAAFICIYRELGLTVYVWKLVPLIAVAFSLEKSTAGFQMLESPLAHFHTLSRGDSLGAFATTLCLRRKDSTPAPTEAPIMSSFSQR